eukprot:766634-Hanusia_phi.AAC.5
MSRIPADRTGPGTRPPPGPPGGAARARPGGPLIGLITGSEPGTAAHCRHVTQTVPCDRSARHDDHGGPSGRPGPEWPPLPGGTQPQAQIGEHRGTRPTGGRRCRR